MGRRKTTFLPYEDAIQFVRKYSDATTRAQYRRWHDSKKPGVVPKAPDRVYEEWSSWNEFLGTTNSFEKKRDRLKKNKVTYRPFWEAVRYAQQKAKEHNITSQGEWEEWHDSGMCAKDVPKRPHHVYDEFTGKGWSVWLGKDIKSKIATAKQNVAVMAVCQTPGYPPNMITIVVEGSGVTALRDRWDRTIVGKPYRIYNWESDLIPYVEQIFIQHSYDKGNKMYLVPNMHALLFELDNILEFTIPPRLLSVEFPVG